MVFLCRQCRNAYLVIVRCVIPCVSTGVCKAKDRCFLYSFKASVGCRLCLTKNTTIGRRIIFCDLSLTDEMGKTKESFVSVSQCVKNTCGFFSYAH